MMLQRRNHLVLSVYCNTRGFAFVLFEGSLSPFDWGMREARGPRKLARSLERITKIVERYLPDVIVIQDTSPTGTRRISCIVRLNSAIATLAEARGIRVLAYSRTDVYRAFEHTGFANKQMLAELIAKHIPVFERYVPPPRKPWMSEDSRMGLFDAAALALVFFQSGSAEK
jgi:hypothetical protein